MSIELCKTCDKGYVGSHFSCALESKGECNISINIKHPLKEKDKENMCDLIFECTSLSGCAYLKPKGNCSCEYSKAYQGGFDICNSLIAQTNKMKLRLKEMGLS